MLAQIRDSGQSVETFVEKVKRKEDGVKLMGFGHRVYKNYDPRARIVKESAGKVLAELGVNDPLLGLAQELEQIALEDDYFKERKLYPNVDFYTGVIYKAMGFPRACSRCCSRSVACLADRPVARGARGSPDQDRPPAAALRRRSRASPEPLIAARSFRERGQIPGSGLVPEPGI